ncbi:4Fe-4S dicluster domain-containing protein [bacterium]|nr:4Fe-4S dicluster domain-containing protein [bacterium]
MKIDRRDFLKMAGASALLGIGGGSIFELLAPGEVVASSGEGKQPAKRWAMAIDMSKFDGDDYKRCIDACHSVHNVPEIDNPKHEVKWIWTETFEHVFAGQGDEHALRDLADKPFLVLCNHCKNPPCVRVCPTKATFKRDDGIVAIDYHRCVGCRFCMVACPFGARSFNFKDPRPFIKEKNKEFPTRTKGVVEKCNFCITRISKGLLPACVEASNGGLIFGDLQDSNSEIRKILGANFCIRRKPELGTYPSVYYVIGGNSA